MGLRDKYELADATRILGFGIRAMVWRRCDASYQLVILYS
jgi:hypothetical protein